MDGYYHNWGGCSWIINAFFILLIIWLIARNYSPHRMRRNDSALDILRERYAKGEIGKEEFEQKKKDLL